MKLKRKIFFILLGGLLSLVILEAGMRMAGGVSLILQRYRNMRSFSGKDKVIILCLGESTTVWGGKKSWPSQLQEILNKKKGEGKFIVINEGRHAISTSYIVSMLDELLDRYKPDVVITMMGINDDPTRVSYGGGSTTEKSLLWNLKVFRLMKLICRHFNWKIKGPELEEKREPAECRKPGYFLKLAREKRSRGEYKEAEDILRAGVELFPENGNLFFELGKYLKDEGKYAEAENNFIKGLQREPLNEWAYLELAQCYLDDDRYEEAVSVIENALAHGFNSENVYLSLGKCYLEMGDFSGAYEIFRKGLVVNPGSRELYFQIGLLCDRRKDYAAAADMFRKAVKANPTHPIAYIELGNCYEKQQAEDAKKKLIRKLESLGLNEERLLSFLGMHYFKKGMYKEAEYYFDKANSLRMKNYPIYTRHNYCKVKEILDERGITWVCVQYPMRSLDYLKKFFDSTEGVVFVDNEDIFKEAVKKGGYEDYFDDCFAGDFGHGTSRGNRLLAENIADTLFKEVFFGE
ncbi:MAG: tetratricopeptide repeat protein [Candidatus Omnitrophica bacterium]|nr:tetratricopeptide repeat protein [Candidatus Omnitrophota bacterium]MBD3269026.1 tetratricopeptide repeat protein [Candidatus Omnitrophota bacterium]